MSERGDKMSLISVRNNANDERKKQKQRQKRRRGDCKIIIKEWGLSDITANLG